MLAQGEGSGGVYMCEGGREWGCKGSGWGLSGSGPIRRFLFICSACLDICLGKDDRIALHWNCATGRGGHCV